MPNQKFTTAATTAPITHTVKFHRADSEYRVLNGTVIVDRFRFDAYDFDDRRRAYRAALDDASARDEAAELAEAEAWLDATPIVTPEPTPTPLPSYTLIPGTVDSPAAMLEAVATYRHAVNTGAQYLLSFQECPQIWAGVWGRLTDEERDDVLAGAQLAGATPQQLSAMARVAVHSGGAPGLVTVQAA